MPRISAFYGIVIWMYHDEVQHLGSPALPCDVWRRENWERARAHQPLRPVDPLR